MKLAVGIPSGDMVHADFMISIVNLVAYTVAQGHQVYIINPKTSIIEVSRNIMFDEALSLGVEYLLTLDSDMIFPLTLFMELIARDVDFVCCDAARRRPPYSSVLQDLNGKPIKHGKNTSLLEIKGASTATLLSKMSAVARIPGPWFKVEFMSEKRFLGEDYFFSNLLRNSGFKVYCDLKLSKEIGHIGCEAHYLKKGLNV